MVMPIRNSQQDWVFPDLIPVPGDFQLAIGGAPLVAKTLYRRGLTSPEAALAFLDPDLYTPSPPSDLPGLLQAADRAIAAIRKRQTILVWGDFDVDGQTATTLLFSSLQKLGARVQHHIPVRATESHGVSTEMLAELIRDLSPQLIITCDTGIDALGAVDYANQAGIDVIITDHHQLPPALPKAHAVVNPNTLPDGHPLGNLPGVGVAYKLAEQIFSQFSEDPSDLLDLVALGIVADVAPQTGDNRFLLQKGLDVLRKTSRPGLQAIYRQNNLDPAQINEEQIGFVIAPRLNALGRLDDANSCVDFFTTDDPERASRLAVRLDELNKIRQKLTEEILQDAENMIAAYPELADEFPVLVLQGSAQWHPGVIGIVASRLAERYQKPVIMLSQDGDQARGSARSIPGVPISDLIGSSGELLTAHGGHPMAAGLSLPLVNVSQFRRSLAAHYRELVGDSAPAVPVYIDSEISFREINLPFIEDFMRLAPFGAGNPKLTFATRGAITDINQIKPIGRNGSHQKLNLTDPNGDQQEFLWWNSADLPIPDMPVDIGYSLEISTYQDRPQIQATLLHLRQSPETPVYLPAQTPYQLLDLRMEDDPLSAVAKLHQPSQSIIWAEDRSPAGLTSYPRGELSKRDTLIIWTSPPNKLALSQAVKKVSPTQIVLVGVDPSISSLDDFIQALLGLLKHLKKSGKPFDCSRFAEVLALPEDVIEVGINWIHLQGAFNLEGIKQGLITAGPGHNLPGFPEADRLLKYMLREILAYRSYFNNADIRAIL